MFWMHQVYSEWGFVSFSSTYETYNDISAYNLSQFVGIVKVFGHIFY